MNVQPISPGKLASKIVRRVRERAGRAAIGVDGAPAALPGELGEAVVEQLRQRGEPALHVRTGDFLRSASLRYEMGKTNPDSFYESWTDLRALRREVLDPLRSTGKVLPTFWNPVTDRATRASYVELPELAVVVVSGEFLLGAGLAFDLTVHLRMSAAAISRRTPEEQQWTLPAYARYQEEVDPESFADLVVLCDDPRHPAILTEGA